MNDPRRNRDTAVPQLVALLFDAAALRGQSSPAGRGHRLLAHRQKRALSGRLWPQAPAAVTFTAGLYLSDRVGLIDLTYLPTGAR